MEIQVINRQKLLAVDPQSVRRLVTEVLNLAGKKCDEVSITLVDEKEICALHKDYFDDPSPTDCLSFPIDEVDGLGYIVLGDVIVSVAAAIGYAKENKTDPYEELALYIIHGLLHLLGHDDTTEAMAKAMRTLEKINLDHLRGAGVYLHG